MAKRIIKIFSLVLFLGIVGIQFVRPNFVNPPVKRGERLEDVYQVPADVASIVKRSCADCHSNETEYPWYSGIAPLSWGMADHIKDGREELNFSVSKTYSDQRQARKLKQMCEEVEAGEMPFYQYLWLHWDARLSEGDKQSLCRWTKTAAKKGAQIVGED